MRSSNPSLQHRSEIGAQTVTSQVGQASSLIRKFEGVDVCDVTSRNLVRARIESYTSLANGSGGARSLDITGGKSVANSHGNNNGHKEWELDNSGSSLKQGSCANQNKTMNSVFGGPSAFKPLPSRSTYNHVQRSTPQPSSPSMSAASSLSEFHRGTPSTSSGFRDSDNGCYSPSRTASFLSQSSAQFSSMMDSDKTSVCSTSGGDYESVPVRDTLPRSSTSRPVPPIKPCLNPPLSAHPKNNSVPSITSFFEDSKSHSNNVRSSPNRNNYSANLGEVGCRSPLRATGNGWEVFYANKSNSSRTTPCDSGDEDMESVLMKKNSELMSLRETMTRNENAILQVLEDKKRFWEIDLIDRNREWKKQMEAMHQKSARKELALQFRIVKLREENKLLIASTANLQSEKKQLSESLSAVETELACAKRKLADLSRRNDLNMDKNSIDSNFTRENEDLSTEKPRISYTRESVRQSFDNRIQSYSEKSENFSSECQNGEHCQFRMNLSAKMENHQCDMKTSASASHDVMARQLKRLQTELDEYRTQFNLERQCWLSEKDKVINYQKYLQLNYLEVLHKNKLLETEMQNLTGEITVGLAVNDVICTSLDSRPQESLC